MDYVSQYIDAIESGTIVVGKRIKQFYCGIIKPIINGLDDKYYFDERPGNRFIKFAETLCRQSKGKWRGQTLKLMLFQKAKYQCLFGIKHRDTKLRRFTEVFDLRGRKNGKSEENAVLGLYLLAEEAGAEVYAAANTLKQARRIFEEARSMINKDKYLQKHYSARSFPNEEILLKERDSYFRVLSSNLDALDGLNCSFGVIDEIHAGSSRDIYDLLKQATSVRDEPLISLITTAGDKRGGLFDDEYELSIKILEGTIEGCEWLMPLLYELDDKNEIDNESCWIKANPTLGTIKSFKFIRDELERAKGDQNALRSIKIKDFNLIETSAVAWLSGDVITNHHVYTDEELRKFDNSVVIGGYDLSRTNDCTAFTTLVFDKENQRIIALTKYWITEEFLDSAEAKASKVPWKAWIDRGLVTISGKSLIDYKDVAKYVYDMFQEHGWYYYRINYDAYSAGYLVQELASYGFQDGSCQVKTQQGFKTLSIPMREMESLLKSKMLCYQNNPVTAWMFSNVELVKDRNDNWMPRKAGDKRANKIDGPATILNALVSFCESKAYYLS